MGTTNDHYKKAIRDQNYLQQALGRLRLFGEDVIEELANFVHEQYFENKTYTYAQLADTLFENTGIRLTGESMGDVLQTIQSGRWNPI